MKNQMAPESGYLEIKALWERFMGALPPMDENLNFIGEDSPELIQARQQLEREHITHIGYLVNYVERLLFYQGIEIDPPAPYVNNTLCDHCGQPYGLGAKCQNCGIPGSWKAVKE